MGLKLFRTSVKENLNVNKVFHYLSERHIEAVSRWSDENGLDENEFDSHLQIGGGNNNGSGNPHRVRFSSSTENIESSSGSSGSSNNSLSYFQATRLLPLNAGNKRRRNKKMQKQQQQQPQFYFTPHPHYGHQFHHAHQFGYPQHHIQPQQQQQQQRQNKLSNPFKRISQGSKKSENAFRLHANNGGGGNLLHHSSAFPPPHNKPAGCRVI